VTKPFRLYRGLTLVKAIETLGSDGILHPCRPEPQYRNVLQTGVLRPTPNGYRVAIHQN
jgi:hypothetical protein